MYEISRKKIGKERKKGREKKKGKEKRELKLLENSYHLTHDNVFPQIVSFFLLLNTNTIQCQLNKLFFKVKLILETQSFEKRLRVQD